jgi:hypothetical protein
MPARDHPYDSARLVADGEPELENDSQSQMLQSEPSHSVANHSVVHPIESISLLHFDLQSPNVANEHGLFHHHECEWNNELVRFQMF